MLRILISALIVAAAAALIFRLISRTPAPAARTMAPEFTLPSQDGTPVSLKDYRGKWVILYFYPKDQTPG
jgi:peroxiredoxin Q/BCP